MNKPPEQPATKARRSTRPPKLEGAESDGWRSAAQTQRLLHELRVHQIELEMQNEELRVSRAEVEAGLKRYTDLYDFSPVGYLTLSPEGSLRELNLPAARLLGRERSRLVGARFATFVSQGTRHIFDAWFASAILQTDKQACEVVLLRDTLPPVFVQMDAKLSFDGQSVRAVVTDITARKALEEELRQAQKMEVVGQLAGGVAHDFNNILTAMTLNLGLLRADSNAQAPEGEVALRSVEALAKRAVTLTSQLLLFSRRQTTQPQSCELNAALTHLLEMLARLLGDEIACHFRPGRPELWVEVDVAMLEQAVLNLCLNARDAMPKGGTVTLETRHITFTTASARSNPKSRVGDFVCLRVSDTGCGMSPDVLEHVFEPFFTTKAVGEGTGLGLASVYGTVHQHQGWLEVESQPGRGSAFSLYLPQSHQPEAAPSEPPAATDARGKGETVLLVEDEPALLAGAERALTRLGYHVLCAADGRQALTLWQQQASAIDLLLTDMRMPNGMNGLALAEKLSEAKPSLKIIIMSGYSAEIATNGAPSCVDFSYLPKPFELKTLATVVRRSLDEAVARARTG